MDQKYLPKKKSFRTPLVIEIEEKENKHAQIGHLEIERMAAINIFP